MAATDTQLAVLTAKDFASDQDVRWCPGCGDYAILAAVRKVCAKMGARKEKTVFVAGIGCSSRFPYYMDTYGVHSIHGRAPAFVTGIKLANPELDVWMVTGDGDGLSIGGNHLLHICRRNVSVNMMLFNNRIYGLTKGQYSPTSEPGKKTKSTPMGSLDFPVNPIAFALSAEATFVARSVDVDKSLPDVLERAAKHPGASFVEIYQDCNIFNHKAFAHATDKDTRLDNVLYLEHGKPMVCGKAQDKGIRLNGCRPEVVEVGGKYSLDDLIVHDETDRTLAYMLSQFSYPHFPEPVGVFYRGQRPAYEQLVDEQLAQAVELRGDPSLEALFNAGDTYDIAPGAEPAHGLHE